MKTISFRCKNKDDEIRSIILCILLFLAGWMLSSAMARHLGENLLVTAGIPAAFLVCGVIWMNRHLKEPVCEGLAQFSDSGRVRLKVGSRTWIFPCANVKNVWYTRDTFANAAMGNGYVLLIRLPLRTIRFFSENPTEGCGFETTGLYAVYEELTARISDAAATPVSQEEGRQEWD